jgi:dCMP deaminase
MVLNPYLNVVLTDGYNGGPRGGTRLCGGENLCTRDQEWLVSGDKTEVGCHHAEQNAVANAARLGVCIQGAWMICTTPPCLACARLVHHAGIVKVVVLSEPYSSAGVEYLDKNNVKVEVLLDQIWEEW